MKKSFKRECITWFENLLFISVIISQASCSLKEDSSEELLSERILNGQIYKGQEVVAIGLLKKAKTPLMFSGSEGNCTATLIGRRTVITAAHCVINAYFKYFWLEDDTAYPVKSAVFHPSYVPCDEDSQGNVHCDAAKNAPFDLAIITLKYFPNLSQIKPLSLSSAAPSASSSQENTGQGMNSTSFQATGYHLVGYGLDGTWNYANQQWEYDQNSVGTKRVADISNSTITLSNSTAYFSITAPNEQSGLAAPGDSGSPILDYSNRIVGIHSLGSQSHSTTHEARVDMALNWIKRVSNYDVIIDGVYQGGQQNINTSSVWKRMHDEPCTAKDQCSESEGLYCWASGTNAKVGFCVKECYGSTTGYRAECLSPSTCSLSLNATNGMFYFCTPLINQQITGVRVQ